MILSDAGSGGSVRQTCTRRCWGQRQRAPIRRTYPPPLPFACACACPQLRSELEAASSARDKSGSERDQLSAELKAAQQALADANGQLGATKVRCACAPAAGRRKSCVAGAILQLQQYPMVLTKAGA